MNLSVYLLINKSEFANMAHHYNNELMDMYGGASEKCQLAAQRFPNRHVNILKLQKNSDHY